MYRDNRGDIKIVTVSDTISESPVANKEQINHINIHLTEIGNVLDNDDLANLDLLPVL